MNIENLTSKQISDKLAEHGIKMHFNSNRKKLEEALLTITTHEDDIMETATADVIELAPGTTHTAEGIELEGKISSEAMKLIRIIVRPNDPLKRESEGDIFTAGSDLVDRGRAVKKYVPYNNEEGWHVPNMIYQNMKEAECQIFKKVRRNGEDMMETHMIKAYNIEVLPQLTQAELDTLASTQKAHNTLG
jgi:NADH dehydrogenase FAD-containing subunit